MMGQTRRICPKCGGLVTIEFEGDWPDHGAKVDCDLCSKASKFGRYKSPEQAQEEYAARALSERRKDDRRIARQERNERWASALRRSREASEQRRRRHREAAEYDTSAGSDTGIFILGLVLVFAVPLAIVLVAMRGGGGGGAVYLSCFVFVVAWLIRDNTKAVQKLRRTVDSIDKRMEEAESKDTGE